MKVTILDVAERDLEEGYRFYERQLPGLGAYFLDSLCSLLAPLILSETEDVHEKVEELESESPTLINETA